MSTVTVVLPHGRYDVHVGAGALVELGPRLAALMPARRAALIYDQETRPWAERAAQSLRDAGFAAAERGYRAGEATKTLETARQLYDWLIDERLERGQPIVALGGGVVGDTVGFVAATFLRGLPLVHCPTSLVAMADSSVGGKVGVNLPQGKNLVGAFHQPQLVLIDVETLETLPDRELRCGLAECVTHAVIADAALFEWIERMQAPLRARQPDAMEQLIVRNVQIKADIVIADEREHGRRALLNLGHTFAHAIETTVGYGRYQHGEAVALGLVAAARLARRLGRCTDEVPRRIEELLQAIGLPTSSPLLPDSAILIAAMRRDKKAADGQIRLVLPRRIGDVTLEAGVPESMIVTSWESLRA